MKPSIMISSGAYYDFLNPDPSVVTVPVIAAALSKLCRFGGHVSRFYSVAEHCVRASYIVPKEDALEALMHDAAEAFVIDLPSPLKMLVPEYREIDKRAEALIAEKFGLRYPWPDSVHHADLVMLATERRDLMPADLPDAEANWALLEGVEPLPEQDTWPFYPMSVWETFPMAHWEHQFTRRYEELAR